MAVDGVSVVGVLAGARPLPRLGARRRVRGDLRQVVLVGLAGDERRVVAVSGVELGDDDPRVGPVQQRHLLEGGLHQVDREGGVADRCHLRLPGAEREIVKVSQRLAFGGVHRRVALRDRAVARRRRRHDLVRVRRERVSAGVLVGVDAVEGLEQVAR